MPSGGARQRAGRPSGTGKFGEPTRAIRVPASQAAQILHLVQQRFYRLPLYSSAVAAGFPSPAESDKEAELDLNELLIKRPAATFFVRVSGSSMIKAGIHTNDILIVDKSLPATHGKIVVAAINGELTVKRLYRQERVVQLVAENDGYPPIEITDETDIRIWGVVTSVIHAV